jgi:nucleoside 2-deoxyribosyltransferase
MKNWKSFNESMVNNKIYLAGGWGKFRDIVRNDTNAFWLNPEDMTNSENWFKLETDAIRECDGMIAWFEKDNKSGFGMTYEMGMAFALNKPYILICEDEEMLKYKFSMQSLGADNTFKSWEEALIFINNTNWMNIRK